MSGCPGRNEPVGGGFGNNSESLWSNNEISGQNENFDERYTNYFTCPIQIPTNWEYQFFSQPWEKRSGNWVGPNHPNMNISSQNLWDRRSGNWDSQNHPNVHVDSQLPWQVNKNFGCKNPYVKDNRTLNNLQADNVGKTRSNVPSKLNSSKHVGNLARKVKEKKCVSKKQLSVSKRNKQAHSPLPGSEEARKKEIAQATDKLKLCLMSLKDRKSELLEDLLSKDDGKKKDKEKCNSSLMDNARSVPELQLTPKDLRDIGKVNNCSVAVDPQTNDTSESAAAAATVEDEEDNDSDDGDDDDDDDEAADVTIVSESFGRPVLDTVDLDDSEESIADDLYYCDEKEGEGLSEVDLQSIQAVQSEFSDMEKDVSHSGVLSGITESISSHLSYSSEQMPTSGCIPNLDFCSLRLKDGIKEPNAVSDVVPSSLLPLERNGGIQHSSFSQEMQVIPRRTRFSSETLHNNLGAFQSSNAECTFSRSGRLRARSASLNSVECPVDIEKSKPESESQVKKLKENVMNQLLNMSKSRLKDIVSNPRSRKLEFVMKHLVKEHHMLLSRRLRLLAQARIRGLPGTGNHEDDLEDQENFPLDSDLDINLSMLPMEVIEQLGNIFNIDFRESLDCADSYDKPNNLNFEEGNCVSEGLEELQALQEALCAENEIGNSEKDIEANNENNFSSQFSLDGNAYNGDVALNIKKESEIVRQDSLIKSRASEGNNASRKKFLESHLYADGPNMCEDEDRGSQCVSSDSFTEPMNQPPDTQCKSSQLQAYSGMCMPTNATNSFIEKARQPSTHGQGIGFSRNSQVAVMELDKSAQNLAELENHGLLIPRSIEGDDGATKSPQQLMTSFENEKSNSECSFSTSYGYTDRRKSLQKSFRTEAGNDYLNSRSDLLDNSMFTASRHSKTKNQGWQPPSSSDACTQTQLFKETESVDVQQALNTLEKSHRCPPHLLHFLKKRLCNDSKPNRNVDSVAQRRRDPFRTRKGYLCRGRKRRHRRRGSGIIPQSSSTGHHSRNLSVVPPPTSCVGTESYVGTNLTSPAPSVQPEPYKVRSVPLPSPDVMSVRTESFGETSILSTSPSFGSLSDGTASFRKTDIAPVSPVIHNVSIGTSCSNVGFRSIIERETNILESNNCNAILAYMFDIHKEMERLMKLHSELSKRLQTVTSYSVFSQSNKESGSTCTLNSTMHLDIRDENSLVNAGNMEISPEVNFSCEESQNQSLNRTLTACDSPVSVEKPDSEGNTADSKDTQRERESIIGIQSTCSLDESTVGEKIVKSRTTSLSCEVSENRKQNNNSAISTENMVEKPAPNLPASVNDSTESLTGMPTAINSDKVLSNNGSALLASKGVSSDSGAGESVSSHCTSPTEVECSTSLSESLPRKCTSSKTVNRRRRKCSSKDNVLVSQSDEESESCNSEVAEERTSSVGSQEKNSRNCTESPFLERRTTRSARLALRHNSCSSTESIPYNTRTRTSMRSRTLEISQSGNNNQIQNTSDIDQLRGETSDPKCKESALFRNVKVKVELEDEPMTADIPIKQEPDMPVKQEPVEDVKKEGENACVTSNKTGEEINASPVKKRRGRSKKNEVAINQENSHSENEQNDITCDRLAAEAQKNMLSGNNKSSLDESLSDDMCESDDKSTKPNRRKRRRERSVKSENECHPDTSETRTESSSKKPDFSPQGDTEQKQLHLLRNKTVNRKVELPDTSKSSEKMNSNTCSKPSRKRTRCDSDTDIKRAYPNIKNCSVVLKSINLSKFPSPSVLPPTISDIKSSEFCETDRESYDGKGNLSEAKSEKEFPLLNKRSISSPKSNLPITKIFEILKSENACSPAHSDPTQEIESQLALLEEMSSHLAEHSDCQEDSRDVDSDFVEVSSVPEKGGADSLKGNKVIQKVEDKSTDVLSDVLLDENSVSTFVSDSSVSSDAELVLLKTPPYGSPGGSSDGSCEAVHVISGNRNKNKHPKWHKLKKSETPERVLFDSHKGSILDLKTFGRHLLAACDDGKVYCYSLKSGKLKHVYEGQSDKVFCLLVLGNPENGGLLKGKGESSLVFTGALDSHLRCFDFKTAALVKEAVNVGSPVQCMDHNWGTIFVGTRSGKVGRFFTKSFKLADTQIDCSKNSILALKATKEGPRNVLIVATKDEPLNIRDATSGLLLRSVGLPRTVISLTMDTSVVYCGTMAGEVIVLPFETGEEMCKVRAGNGVSCLKIYNNLLFAGCYDGFIYVYDIKTQSLLTKIDGGKMMLCLDVVKNRIISGSKSLLQVTVFPMEVRNFLKELKHPSSHGGNNPK